MLPVFCRSPAWTPGRWRSRLRSAGPVTRGEQVEESGMGVAPLQGLPDLGSWRSGGMGSDPPRGCGVEGSDGLRAGATGSGGTRRHGCGWDGRPGQERPDSAQRITTAVMPVSAILSSTGNFSPPALRRVPATRSCRQDGGACRRLVGNEATLTLRAQWSSGTPTHRRTASFPGQAVPAEEPHPSGMDFVTGPGSVVHREVTGDWHAAP
jgi:hypothetical protein